LLEEEVGFAVRYLVKKGGDIMEISMAGDKRFEVYAELCRETVQIRLKLDRNDISADKRIRLSNRLGDLVNRIIPRHVERINFSDYKRFK